MTFNGRAFSAAVAVLVFTCMALPVVAAAQGTEPTPIPVMGPTSDTDEVVYPTTSSTPPPSPKAGRRYTDPLVIELGGEFMFDGRINDDDDDKEYTFMFGPLLGVFVIKGLQLGGIPSVWFLINDNGRETTTVLGGLTLFLRYIFDIRSIVFPFVGSKFGALGGESEHIWGEQSLTVLNIGPEVGIKVLAGKKVIITIFFEYLFNSMKIEDFDDWQEYHTIRLGAEIGFWVN